MHLDTFCSNFLDKGLTKESVSNQYAPGKDSLFETFANHFTFAGSFWLLGSCFPSPQVTSVRDSSDSSYGCERGIVEEQIWIVGNIWYLHLYTGNLVDHELLGIKKYLHL